MLPGFWCYDCRLTFDASGVLRRWTYQSFFPGGELRPEPYHAGYEQLAPRPVLRDQELTVLDELADNANADAEEEIAGDHVQHDESLGDRMCRLVFDQCKRGRDIDRVIEA